MAFNHIASCECKEGFHGNGTDSCVPDGFTEEANGKHYRMFDDKYVEWEEAHTHCDEMGARLPVLDSKETIGNVQLFVNLIFILYARWRFKIVCLQTKLASSLMSVAKSIG